MVLAASWGFGCAPVGGRAQDSGGQDGGAQDSGAQDGGVQDSGAETGDATSDASTEVASCSAAALTRSPYAWGDGTALNPYTVCTAVQLNAVGSRSADWGAAFRLGANIDLSGVTWNMIGTTEEAFSGTLDGAGFSVSGFSLASAGDDRGFFGRTQGATISDLTLSLGGDVDAGGGSYRVGALIGQADGGSVTRVTVDGTGIVRGSRYVGGAIGGANRDVIITSLVVHVAVVAHPGFTDIGGAIGNCDGTLTGAIATGAVDCTASGGETSCGGLVGALLFNGNVSRSFATGPVSAAGAVTSIAGLTGYCAGAITDSYAAGSVHGGDSNVGGLVGFALSGYCNVSRTYSSGAVSGSGSVGGLLGYGRTISASFWDPVTSGQESSAGGRSASTEAMTSTDDNANGRIDLYESAEWSSEVWNLAPGAYPTLL